MARCGFCGDPFPCRQCFLHKRIGAGAFGEVWAATICNKPRALKILKVCQESQEFPTVHHTALVELQACATRGLLIPERAWLHPETQTLSFSMPRAVCDVQALEMLGRPPLGALACVAAAVTKCLMRMHGRGFMHRDITAKNVLVMQDGSCVVCDKSLVRRMWGKSILRSCYTPKVTAFSYRAPELLANSSTPLYDERVDIWGLGCVIAELLLQDLLFEFMAEQCTVHLAAAMLVSGCTAWPQASIPISKRRLQAISRHTRSLRATFAPIRTMVENHWSSSHSAACASKEEGRRKNELLQAIDFCSQCLQLDPEKRPSASTLLKHAFVKRADATQMVHHLKRLRNTPRVQFSSTGHRIASPLAREHSGSSGKSGMSGSVGSLGSPTSPKEGWSLRDIARNAIEIPLTPLSPPSRSLLRRITAFPALRVAMADAAARMLWPPSHLAKQNKPAAWSCFATAMHLFDAMVVRLPLLVKRLSAQSVDAPEPLSFILACCVLAAQREGRMFAISERRCPQERSVTTAALKTAVTTLVVALHGMTLPLTMVDVALTHATEVEACVVAAAYASISPQLLGKRGAYTPHNVQQCMKHQVQLLRAFQNITGLDAWTGKATVDLPHVTQTVLMS